MPRRSQKMLDEIKECLAEIKKGKSANYIEFYHGEKVFNQKEVALAMVKRNGTTICEFNEKIRDNEEIARAALKTNGNAYECLSDRLKNRRDFALIAVKYNARNYEKLPENLKYDTELATIAASGDYYVFKKMPDICKDNINVAKAAVKKIASNIQYVGTELRNNKEFMVYAARIDTPTFYYASDELKKDKEFILYLLKKVDGIVKQICDNADISVLCDKDVAIAIVSINGRLLSILNAMLKQDEDVVFAAIKNNGRAIIDAHPSFMNNKLAILTALGTYPELYDDLNKQFQMDYDIIAFLLANKPTYASNNVRLMSYYNLYLLKQAQLINELRERLRICEEKLNDYELNTSNQNVYDTQKTKPVIAQRRRKRD